MIASEARIATFLAIARDEVPKESWFKLGREHTRAFGRFLLLSWTGTMFEYLMPALWMRSYPETLISRTLAACVYVQRAFARSLKIPWGISESGASRKGSTPATTTTRPTACRKSRSGLKPPRAPWFRLTLRSLLSRSIPWPLFAICAGWLPPDGLALSDSMRLPTTHPRPGSRFLFASGWRTTRECRCSRFSICSTITWCNAGFTPIPKCRQPNFCFMKCRSASRFSGRG